MSKNMSKKTKDTGKAQGKKPGLKPFIIAAAAVVVFAAAVFGLVKAVQAANDKTFDVAFYNLPQAITEPLQQKIAADYEKQTGKKVNFVQLTDDQFDSEQISKAYDLFFSWNGSAVNALQANAQKIPAKAYSYIISSEIPQDLNYLPLALDHWQMTYYIRGVRQTTAGYPRSLADLKELLTQLKQIVFVPMYCSGGNDNELLALISSFTEAIGGSKAYSQLVKIFSTTPVFADTLDVELDAASKLTLRSVLDTIKDWQAQDLLYAKWIYSKDGELINLGKERHIGAFFTTLTRYRNLPLSVSEGYAADRFPLVNNDDRHGLIANSVVCVKLNATSKYDGIIASLVEPDFQYELSTATQLGPVSLTSQSYDRQADDVRYLAAVSEEGAVPDLANACFQTDSSKKAYFAQQIRNYLK